jgi:hypothetical protein
MKNPAESMAGTTATFRVDFSGAPKLVGSPLASEVVVTPLLLPPDEEQPAANPATAVSAAAHAVARFHLRLPVTKAPH